MSVECRPICVSSIDRDVGRDISRVSAEMSVECPPRYPPRCRSIDVCMVGFLSADTASTDSGD